MTPTFTKVFLLVVQKDCPKGYSWSTSGFSIKNDCPKDCISSAIGCHRKSNEKWCSGWWLCFGKVRGTAWCPHPLGTGQLADTMPGSWVSPCVSPSLSGWTWSFQLRKTPVWMSTSPCTLNKLLNLLESQFVHWESLSHFFWGLKEKTHMKVLACNRTQWALSMIIKFILKTAKA